MQEIFDLLDTAAKDYPLKALAGEIDKNEKTLRNELTQQGDFKLGITTAILIMKKTGDLRALDRIESFFNRVAFVMPEPRESALTVMKLAGKLSKEFGEHMVSLGAAIEDGKIARQEARTCLGELKDVIEACVRLQAYLERLV